jgi:hypothetical protein
MLSTARHDLDNLFYIRGNNIIPPHSFQICIGEKVEKVILYAAGGGQTLKKVML